MANAIHLVWAEENPEIGAGLQDQQGALADVLSKQQAKLSQAAAPLPMNPAPISQPDDWNAFPEEEPPEQAPIPSDTKSTGQGEIVAKSHGSMNPIGTSKDSGALEEEKSSKALEKDNMGESADMTPPKEQSDEKEGGALESDELEMDQDDATAQEESSSKPGDAEEAGHGIEAAQTVGTVEVTEVEDPEEEYSLELDEGKNEDV